MAITSKQVADLAMLARLDISAEQAEALRPQLDSILEFVAKLLDALLDCLFLLLEGVAAGKVLVNSIECLLIKVDRIL